LSGRGSKRSDSVPGAESGTGKSTVESWALSLAGVLALFTGVSVEAVDA